VVPPGYHMKIHGALVTTPHSTEQIGKVLLFRGWPSMTDEFMDPPPSTPPLPPSLLNDGYHQRRTLTILAFGEAGTKTIRLR
jgi:hypothetical protein